MSRSGLEIGPPEARIAGTLHVYVAFDWGEELRLDVARQLVPAEVHVLPRRRRTPPSIAYRPPPLRFHLHPPSLPLAEIGAAPVAAEATVFDFAAVSVAFHVPFDLPRDGMARLIVGQIDRPHSPFPELAPEGVTAGEGILQAFEYNRLHCHFSSSDVTTPSRTPPRSRRCARNRARWRSR